MLGIGVLVQVERENRAEGPVNLSFDLRVDQILDEVGPRRSSWTSRPLGRGGWLGADVLEVLGLLKHV